MWIGVLFRIFCLKWDYVCRLHSSLSYIHKLPLWTTLWAFAIHNGHLGHRKLKEERRSSRGLLCTCAVSNLHLNNALIYEERTRDVHVSPRLSYHIWWKKKIVRDLSVEFASNCVLISERSIAPLLCRNVVSTRGTSGSQSMQEWHTPLKTGSTWNDHFIVEGFVNTILKTVACLRPFKVLTFKRRY